MKPSKKQSFSPGDLVKVCLREGKPNILCWIIPAMDYNAYGPTTELTRVPAGTIGLYLGVGQAYAEINFRHIFLVEDKLISILAGFLEKIGGTE